MPTLTREREPSVTPKQGYLDMENPIEGFDWEEFAQALERIQSGLATAASFLVIFTSEQRDELSNEDKELLRTLDDAAHDEASASRALIKYFAGDVDEQGRALSWCLWSDRKAAAEALHGPHHKEAIRLAKAGRFYKQFMVRFYSVSHTDGVGFRFAPLLIEHHS